MSAMILDMLARSPREALALDVALKATLVLAAAGVAALALRRSSAAARHLAWGLGLAGALALPVLGLALPGWSWRVLPISAGTDWAPRAKVTNPPVPRTGWTTPSSSALDETALDEDALAAIAPAAHTSRPTPANPTASPSDRWWHLTPSWAWLWAAWLAGALAVVSRSLAGWIAVRQLSREARPIDDAGWSDLVRELSNELGLTRRILLLRSGRAVMPMTWGWTRPVILLPSDADAWDDARRRAVLLHELAHIRRLDCPTQALARLACVVYWFHPLAWLAERRMRIERERACDDIVLLAGARASEYASHLLETARGLRVPRAAALAATAMARPSQLEGRLVAILDPSRRRAGPGRKPAAIALLAAVVALVPLAMLRVGARAAGPMPPSPDPIADDRPATDPAGRMTVTGRVLDPSGKPVPNATVAISLRRKLLFTSPGDEGNFPVPAGHGASDASGRFRIDAARTSSAHHAEFAATALAPGYGVGWAELDPDEDRPSAEIRLMPEQVIEGRLFDVQGRSVAGAVISVWAIWRTLPPTVLFQGREVEDHREGPFRWWGRVHDGLGWPKPATTDAEGRFTLHGIGPGLHARLSVLDPRFAPQTIEVNTDASAGVKSLKAALLPARTLTGRVTYADTGRPVAHAEVHIGASDGPGGVRQGGLRYLPTEADAEGRFRVPVMPGDRPRVWAAAPDGQPYLRAGETLAWPKEATEQAVALALPRGVLIRGKVTEESTGQPVADALVHYTPSAPRPARAGTSGPALTKADGSFAIVVGTGAQSGHLTVQAPGEDYQPQVISGARLNPGNRSGFRLYAHAFLPYDPKPGTEPPEIRVALRRGATVRFRLIGPDGQPVRDVRVYSRAVLGPTASSAVRMWWPATSEVARRGHFEVHGLDPDTEVPVHFLQPESKLGATARISGRMATQGPVTVRLEPCGTAMARLVGPDGRPVTGQPLGVSIMMVVTPGPPILSAETRAGALAADEDHLGRVDPINHGNGWAADAQGRITLPALIPGATYRIIDGRNVRREFAVGPGEAAELGDITITKPRGRN